VTFQRIGSSREAVFVISCLLGIQTRASPPLTQIFKDL